MNKYNVSLDDLGARIRNIRVNIAKMTMEEFSDKIKETSNGKVNPGKSNVSRWERGLNLPNDLTLKSIADISGISVEELLYGSLDNYSYNVMIEDIKAKGSLWDKFKLHYIRCNELEKTPPSDEELESIAIEFITENFSKIYEIMFSSQRIMYANFLKYDDEAQLEQSRALGKEKLMNYGREKEILMYANLAIGKLLPFDTTYEESRDLVVGKLSELNTTSGTVYSYDELFERNIKNGMDETAAKKKAFNQFYKSELFKNVKNLKKNIKKLDEEAQLKQEELNISEESQN